MSARAADINGIMPPEKAGGKGHGLSKLVAYGFPVPEFFVLDTDTDYSDESIYDEIKERAAKIGDVFAVRSSNVNEDRADMSYAGQYFTEINVPLEELPNAIKRVAASREGKNVEAYSHAFGSKPSGMAVIIQRQITGSDRLSGVMFSSSATSRNDVTIEYVRGEGEKLVGGSSTPVKLVFDKQKAKPDGVFGMLAEAALSLEQKENGPVDVEWTYSDGKLWFLQLRRLTALGDDMPISAIDGEKWSFYVYRDFCEYAHGIQTAATLPEIQIKKFGFSVPVFSGVLVNGREFYSCDNDARQCELWRGVYERGGLENFATHVKKISDKARRGATMFKRYNFAAMSDELLCAAHCKVRDKYLESYLPLMMRPDDFLEIRLRELTGDGAERVLSAAASLVGKTFYECEHIAFLKGVLSDEMRKAYLENYEWFISPLGRKFVSVTAERFDRRAARTNEQKARQLIAELFANRLKERKAARAVFASLSGEALEIAELARRFIFLRTYAAESSDRYFYYFRKLVLNEICKRAGIDDDMFAYMTLSEFDEACSANRLPSPLSSAELRRRKSGCAVIWTDGVPKAYFGQKSYGLLKRLVDKAVGTQNTSDGVLSGDIACYGEAVGKVKIVNSYTQAAKIERGDILVSTMTTPELTGVLDLVGGIITDEGGITCHAAIVAREYATPCLVGTGNATEVLRDGMTVKLDCINGRAEILTDGHENDDSPVTA